jgi:uncharacterized protein YbaP (TraB family)
MFHRLRALFVLCALTFVAAPQSAAAETKTIEAHPAMWTVHGLRGTAYLLGSIHVLPAYVHWQTKEISAAMNSADVFVFEVPLDHQDQDAKAMADIQKKIMDQHGLLPPGQSLRGSLPKGMVDGYDATLATLEISPGYVDRLKPWLAALVIDNAELGRTDYEASQGVDRRIYAIATAAHKPTRGLETFEDQVGVITPEEQKAGFEALSEQITVATKSTPTQEIDALVADWARGDVNAIAKASDTALSRDPAFRKVLLDNRNARWVPEIETMLDTTDKTYFITVGAAHLAGPGGVPARLRKAGYRVDGPG